MNTNTQNTDAINKLTRLRKKNYLITTSIGLSFAILVIDFILLAKSEHAANGKIPSIPALVYVLIFLSVIGYICIASVLLAKNRQKYKNVYKQSFVMSELSKSFDVITYDWERGFDKDHVELFGISEMGNRFYSEDYLKGVYNDILFEQADVIIEHETTIGNNTSVETLFEGRMYVFDFPKSDVDRVQIYSKSYTHAPSLPAGIPVQTVTIQNKAFQELFVVKASNERDAYDLLTPAVIERILSLVERYPELSMCFAGGKLHIGATSHGDAFDSSIHEKLSYSEEIENIRYDIQAITDIIDIMTQNSIL